MRLKPIGWLAALVMCCFALAGAPASAWAVEDNSQATVYVSKDGDDSNDGTEDNPVATLKRALELVADGGTVHVTTPLTIESMARIDQKSATIDGNGNTITRSEDFAATNDEGRGGYNPELIEVANRAELTLVDITLDDAFLTEGTVFKEQESGDGHGNNADKVQGAIIAAYGDGAGTIILGDGAVLKNFGGMSAVRIGGNGADGDAWHGSSLIMESGSSIIDDASESRKGGAAAVWNQGGMFEMQAGSSIKNIDGRAVYSEDGGVNNVSGLIDNIKSNDVMSSNPDANPPSNFKNEPGKGAMNGGFGGIAAAVIGNSEFTLKSGGTISNIASHDSNSSDVAVWQANGRNVFTTEQGSLISNCDGIGLIDSNTATVILGGRIEDCNGSKNVLIRPRGAEGTLNVESTAVIENCDTTDVGVIHISDKQTLVFAGEITGCKGDWGVISFSYNKGGAVPVGTFIEGTNIHDNQSTGIRLTNGAKVTLNGGNISGNDSYGVCLEGKTDSQFLGTSFIMNGGTIVDNGSYGIYHIVAGESLVEINGGTISGNKGLNGRQIYSYGGYAVAEQEGEAGYEYTHVAANTMGEPRTVHVSAGTVTLPGGYADVNLGHATTAAVDALEAGVAEEHSGWTAVGSSALWVQPSATEFSFELDPTSAPKKTGLFVAYVQVKPDGSPLENAEVTVEEVENVESIPITLKGLTADAPYAVMLFNNAEYTLAPDDITIYIGGGQGDEDNYKETGGFPEITLLNSIDLSFVKNPATEEYGDDLKSLEVDDELYTATAEASLVDQLIDLLVPTYTYEDGTPASNDARAGVYTVKLAWKNGLSNEDVRVNGNEVNLDGAGKLIVRHIEDIEGAIEGTTTHELLESEPTNAVTQAEAIAKTGTGVFGDVRQPSFYTNDDEDREVDAKGIQLLDDGLLKYEGEDRTTPMENKGDEYLGSAGEGKEWSYEFHYLDLVDAYNGNAWVSASYGTTIYLPYPEGVTVDNAKELGVTVIHYKGLHREYGITGQDDVEAAIKACEMETMKAEFTDKGIKFDTERAGFSPFAIAWKTDAPDEPDTPVTPPSRSYTITASAGEGGSISPSGKVSVAAGADRTFTFEPDEGHRVADVVVDGESLGALGSYTFEDVSSDHTIQVVFEPGYAPADPDDTGVSDWLDTVNHDAYLNGYQDGSNTFRPNGDMTRGEVACMFYNLLLDKSAGDEPVAFEDVPEGAYYAEPVRVLASRGILFGTSPTTFDPDRPITRAEFTAIAMRFTKGDLSGENIFVDVPEGAWYHDVVVGSIKYGWIYGYQDGSHRFGPDGTITRAEATCIANRMLGRLPDGAYIAGHKDELKLFGDVDESHFAWRDIVEATNAHTYVRDGGYEDWTGLEGRADA